MVGMGIHLEEVVREGRMTRDEGSSNGTKNPCYGFAKNKEQDSNPISQGRPRSSHSKNHHQQ